MKTHFLYGSMILQEISIVNPNTRKTFAYTTDTETVILLRGVKMQKSLERARMLMRTKVSMHVESCVLLERVSKRKADYYVKLNVMMEEYYRII